jgi:hypothetical protein
MPRRKNSAPGIAIDASLSYVLLGSEIIPESVLYLMTDFRRVAIDQAAMVTVITVCDHN